jgi:HNH endonuclease/NUMOD4 motif
MEVWRSVVGFAGIYEVSDQGNVASCDRIMKYPSGRVCRYKGKLLSPGKTGDRLTVVLCNSEGQRSYYVHDLVLTAFVGPCPDGQEGCHNDGNGTHNSLVNLRWDTRSENTYDRVRHGTHHAKNRETCPLSHLLTMPNLVAVPWIRYQRRSCLACNRASACQSYAIKVGAPYDFKAEANFKYKKIMGLEEAA